MKSLSRFVLMGVFFAVITGCHTKSRFVVNSSDPELAMDNVTGKECHLSPFTEEDKAITQLKQEKEEQQRAELDKMIDKDAKERILKRLTKYKDYPVCPSSGNKTY